MESPPLSATAAHTGSPASSVHSLPARDPPTILPPPPPSASSTTTAATPRRRSSVHISQGARSEHDNSSDDEHAKGRADLDPDHTPGDDNARKRRRIDSISS